MANHDVYLFTDFAHFNSNCFLQYENASCTGPPSCADVRYDAGRSSNEKKAPGIYSYTEGVYSGREKVKNQAGILLLVILH